MNRREAISRIGLLAGGTLSASTIAGLLAGCTTPSPDLYTPHMLSEVHFELIGSIAESILPETDTHGALAAGVHRFIDTMLAEYYPPKEAAAFLLELSAFDSTHRASQLTQDALDVFIGDVDRRAFHPTQHQNDSETQFYRTLKGLVVSGYYTSEVGMTQELRLKPYGDSRMDIPFSEGGHSWSN